MKRQLAASAVGVDTPRDDDAAGGVATQTPPAFKEGMVDQPATGKGGRALRSVGARTHTLVLTGELTQRSAHALEVEIERLCGESVTGITLDLRELEYIDPIGVAVVAFHSGLCGRRGYDFALIPGSRFIRRAFEQAGVTNLLPGT